MSIHVEKIKKDPFNYSNSLTVNELEDVIKYSNEKYRNDNPVISDAIYDILIDFLKHKSPKNKLLTKIGSDNILKDKIKLDYHLGSMDKIKPPSPKLNDFKKKYHPPYILSDKLDGVSALLIYKKKKSS